MWFVSKMGNMVPVPDFPDFQDFRTPAASIESSASLRFFVQDFYNWYVPRFWKSSPKPAVKIALRRRALFSAELTAALGDHLRRLGKHRRASAAYLYDPILNAGDACERYRVGRQVRKASTTGLTSTPYASATCAPRQR